MDNNYLPIPKNFSTLSIHSSIHAEDNDYISLVPPVVSSVNFKVHLPLTEERYRQKYVYALSKNPSRCNLEHCLATLEGAEYGICFASGIGTLTSLLATLKPRSHIICGTSIFAGSSTLLTDTAKSFGFSTSFVNVCNLDDLKRGIQSTTALIWIEPISNPLMQVADVKSISKIAQENKILLAVDNTFLTPYFHRPLELGADIVSYSLTKYISGHGDVVMGAVMVNKIELYNKISSARSRLGIIPSPIDCNQVIRSLKTLSLRMKQHSINAVKVAQFLEKHSKVVKVIHPGLPSHPQHELFKSQSSGHSGLISFYIDGGLQQSKQLLNNFKLIIPTASFGLTDSLAEIPSIMSYSPLPKERRDPNVTDNLIRISVGLEDCEDIINDLEQALEQL